MTYSFGSPLLDKGSKQALQLSDLEPLSDRDHASHVTHLLAVEWEREIQNASVQKPQLWRAMYRSQRSQFWTAAWYCFLESLSRILAPVMLKLFLDWLQTDNPDQVFGISVALIIGVLSFLQAHIHHKLYYFGMRGGWNLRLGTIGLIHKKVLRLAPNNATQGEVINLASNDVQRHDNFMPFLHFLWSAPMDLLAVFIIMWSMVGSAALAGIGSQLLVIPLQVYFGKQFAKRRRATASFTGERVRRTAELLAGIVSVKACTWEAPFRRVLAKVRDQERQSILRSQAMKAFNLALYFSGVAVSSLVTFTVYWAQGHVLRIPTVFSVLSLLHVVRFSMGRSFPLAVENAPEWWVSMQRIQQFLLLPDIGPECIDSGAVDGVLRQERAQEYASALKKGGKSLPALPLQSIEAQLSGTTQSATAASSGSDKLSAVSSSPVLDLQNCSFAWQDAHDAKANNASAAADPNAAVSLEKKLAGVESDTGVDTGGNTVILQGISLTLHPGELLMVVGAVGSGKSSLLCALLGELKLQSGSVVNACRPGIGGATSAIGGSTIGYASQRPWIVKGSLRDNILFGTPLEQVRYDQCLRCCALDKDLSALSDGDLTQIGERGINLSGGQKARVALARAVYADASLYLLDDPLSAVDPRVSRQLFRECILGTLLGRDGGAGDAQQAGQAELGGESNVPSKTKKAVVLVTHQLQYLPHADKVLVLTSEGAVEGYGTPAELASILPSVVVGGAAGSAMEGGDGDAVIVAQAAVGGGDKPGRGSEASGGEGAPLEASAKKGAVVQLVENEDRKIGVVDASTYMDYMRHGGLSVCMLLLFQFVLAQLCLMGSDWWLLHWTSQSPTDQRNAELPAVFGALSGACVLLGFSRAYLFFRASLRASSRMHDSMFQGVLGAPFSFFSANPTGRILNKFSSDQGQVDEILPITFYDFVQAFFLCLGAVVLACAAVPWLAIALLPGVVVFLRIRGRFLASSRELKRLDAISRSPVYAELGTAIGGLMTLRAFGAGERTHISFLRRLEDNGRTWYWFLIISRWMGFWLDCICAALVLLLVLAGAALHIFEVGPDSGLLGFAIVHAMSLSGIFQWCIRQSAAVETYMTSVERLLYYSKLESEVDAKVREVATAPAELATSDGGDSPIGDDWPQAGAIECKDLCIRYRHDLPLVLKGVSVSIPAGSKVGLVGRTGSGKSTLGLALLRLNERVAAAGGSSGGVLAIDGVDISSPRVPLALLRSRVCLIPQEPTLFSGSLRLNLDPFSRYGDEQLLSALEAVQLRKATAVETGHPSMVGGGGLSLELVLSEGGENLSIGQRQLLSLARAILQASKVVIMDEATANVDFETDNLIQHTIREAACFKSATRLIIAHRITTVMDSDIVLVMAQGKVAECGAPSVLLERDGGVFREMVGAADASKGGRV
jgi:ATP-binding cassette subfamily C (CFTR/MRP) protein 4